MQRLIVLSYVLAGTDLPSADRLITVLEPKALIRAPTMRSAKLDRRSANREVPWTLEAPVLATCQAAFSLTPFAVSKHRLPFVARSSTNIIDQRAQRAYLSINRPISTGNPALAKQLPAVARSQHLQRPKPQGTAVTASSSHSPIKRIEPHRPTHRPNIVPPANRIARRIEPYRIPVPCNWKPPFPSLPRFATIIISKRTAFRSISPLPRNPRRLSANRRPFAHQHPQIPPVFPTSNRHQHNIAPYSASQPPLKAFPQVATPASFPHIQAILPFCLTMPQAPRLLVWFLTLPSQIARAALRRIGGKLPCPLTICSLVRFTETKQRRLLATKSNQKRRN